MDIATQPTTNRFAPRSVFPTPAARAALLSLYDAKLAKWPVPFEERDVRSRWGTTHAVIAGDAALPPLVLLPMAGVPSFSWAALVAPLVAIRRVYAIDTIGDAGKSELDDPRRHPASGGEYAGWLGDVLGELGVGRPDVVAASMGGWIAMNHAAFAPDRIRRLALLAPMGLPTWTQTMRVLARLGTIGAAPSAAKRDRLVAWAVGDSPVANAALADWLRAMLDAGVKPRLAAPLPVPTAILDRIEAPTLVLLGDRDGPIGDATKATKRAHQIRDAEVDVIEGAGHALMVEAPQRVLEKLVPFLEGTRWPV